MKVRMLSFSVNEPKLLV